MLKSNKELIQESEQQRKRHTKFLNHLKHVKEQKKHQQLIVSNQYLDNSNYNTVLSRDVLKYFCKAISNNKLKIDIYNDYDFSLAKELLNLNSIKIVHKSNHYLTFSTTKLGKELLRRLHYNIHQSNPKSQANHYWKLYKITGVMSLLYVGIMGIMTFISLGLNSMPLVSLFVVLVCCSLPMGAVADNYESKYNKLASKSMNTDISNKKALLALKKLLTPNEYSQEFKMFKKYAKKD